MYFDWTIEGEEMKWLLDKTKDVKSHQKKYKKIKRTYILNQICINVIFIFYHSFFP